MKRSRRLRRLVPDAELVHRRAAGETVRELAADYGVAHTTLGRYFARPEITSQLKRSGRLVRRERRAAAGRRALERRMEREVRRQAKQQVALEGRLRAARAVRAAGAAARGRRRSAYAAWLDERDAWLPLTRADRHSRNDELAAQTVADGAGVHAHSRGNRVLVHIEAGATLDKAIHRSSLLLGSTMRTPPGGAS